MSKKSKRAKLLRPMKQLQQRPSGPSQVHEQLAKRIQYATQQMREGDFADAISTCESLLNSLPRHSAMRVEVLTLLGLAHGMLQNYQQSYDILSEAITINPTLPELWYNLGLASHFMGRPGEAVQHFERAVELSKNDTGEMARRFAMQLEGSRQELQEVMQLHGPDITFEQYCEREERFRQAMSLVKQEKWQEAELLFRQLTETGSRMPAYWGNLGVCLMMQFCYDEAEVALKQALAIDPDYPIARDNLRMLPQVRRSRGPIEHKLRNLAREDDTTQLLTLYEKDAKGEIIASTTIEKAEHTAKDTWRQPGKQPLRYNVFFNLYQDMRFMTCPQCGNKTRLRKFSLVIAMDPEHVSVMDKMCRFCDTCDLLIVHQDQLKSQIILNLIGMIINQEISGDDYKNDYQVIGTLDRTEWKRGEQRLLPFEEVVEYLHNFKEVMTF